MKKLLAMVTLLIMVLVLVGCGSPTEEQPEEQISYEIALVTDAGLIMDGGYSEVAWNAISEFGATQGISHKYYKAAEATEESYQAAIEDAVKKGAKIIITDGFSFENVIYEMQKKHEDVKFVLIDAKPVDSKNEEAKIAENTAVLLFSCEEAGYLAGYAAVEDGITQLGFIGEANQPIYDDFGYGFLQGANAAAENNGVIVEVKYHACDESNDRDVVFEKAESWYKEGTEAIFVCGEHVENAVIQAAELNDGKVIACETDKSRMSDTIITSAIKDIEGVINEVLGMYIKNKFPGGETMEFDTSTSSIWFNMETSKFKNFTVNEYKNTLRELGNKYVEVQGHSVGNISDLQISNVRVYEK